MLETFIWGNSSNQTKQRKHTRDWWLRKLVPPLAALSHPGFTSFVTLSLLPLLTDGHLTSAEGVYANEKTLYAKNCSPLEATPEDDKVLKC